VGDDECLVVDAHAHALSCRKQNTLKKTFFTLSWIVEYAAERYRNGTYLWQPKTAVFLHRCLIHSVLFILPEKSFCSNNFCFNDHKGSSDHLKWLMCTCLGHLERRDTDRIISIYVMPPKVARASK
jgi:hypothetical protein